MRTTLFITASILIISGSATVFAATDRDVRERLDAVESQMQRLERVMDSNALLDLHQQVNSLEREIQGLRDENERLRYELEDLRARQREMFISIDKRIQGQGNQSSKPTQSRPATPVPTKSPPVTVNTNSTEATEAYREAFILLKKEKYEESIVAFDGFLKAHPKSKFAANAQYWQAEAHYKVKNYEQALAAFKKVIDKYPASAKVPDARLKLGFTYYELEKWEEARQTLTRLRAQFPNSSVAGLAQQRLELMDTQGH